MTDDEEPLTVSEYQRQMAHATLDAWLSDCQREVVDRLPTGTMGHLGTFKITARFNDEGIYLTLQRAIEVDL